MKDITTHPAFRNSARMIARLYDALHDPAKKDVLTVETDTGSAGFTHKFFRTPKSAEDLVGCRDAIAEWARMTYGWMGRAPDYKGSFLATLDANAEFYAPYQANALRWYKEAQEKVLYFNHAIIHPPVDRNLPPDQVGDVYVHVEKETDAGLVVSGDRVSPDPLQFHRPLRLAAQEEGVCHHLCRPHGCAWCEADFPYLL